MLEVKVEIFAGTILVDVILVDLQRLLRSALVVFQVSIILPYTH